MEPCRAQKNRISRFIDKWRRRLFLQEWTINTFWMKEDLEDERFADVQPSPAYLVAKLRVFPHLWNEPISNQEEIMVHELCHCITQEVADLCYDMRNGKLVTEDQIQKAVERLTQRITNIAFQDEW